MSARFSRFCSELEKKGVQILENDVKIYKGNTVVRASGTLTMIEPAIEFRDTQITAGLVRMILPTSLFLKAVIAIAIARYVFPVRSVFKTAL